MTCHLAMLQGIAETSNTLSHAIHAGDTPQILGMDNNTLP